MNTSLIAVRYAKALLKLSLEKGVEEIVYNDLVRIGDALIQNAELQTFLVSRIYKVSQKKQLVDKLFKSSCSPISLKFIYLIIDKGREDLILNILRDFRDLYYNNKGIKRILYCGVVAPTAEFENSLKLQLESLLNCKVELTIKVKPELIGGFELVIDGKLLDASILSKLKLMKKRLVG